MTTAWIDHVELELSYALDPTQPARVITAHDGTIIDRHPGGPDFGLAIQLLLAYAEAAHRWLDDVEHRQSADVDRVKAIWSLGGMAWEHLHEETHPHLAPLLAVWKRLRGLSVV